MTRLVCSLLLVLAVGPAWASTGIYQRADCTTITTPATNKTWCFDESSTGIKYYDGTRWKQSNAVGMLDVTDYGAKGDGVTNDATAIQAAIDAATAAAPTNGATLVRFPKGRYRLTASLNPKSNVWYVLYGASIEVATDLDAFNAAQTVDNVRFYGGHYVGVGVTSNAKAAIKLGGASGSLTPATNVMLEDIRISNYDWGIYFNATSYASIRGVMFLGVDSTNGDAVILNGSKHITVSDVVGKDFKKNLFYASKSTGDVQNEYITVTNITGNALSGSTVSTGIAVRNLRRSTITNFVIDSPYAGGIFAQTEAADTTVIEDVTFSNGIINNAGRRAIIVSGFNRADSTKRVHLANIKVNVAGALSADPSVQILNVKGGSVTNLSVYDSQGTNGISVSGSQNMRWTNIHIENTDQIGLLIEDSGAGAAEALESIQLTFSGLTIKDSSQDTDNTYNDISILDNSSDIILSDFQLHATATNKSARGIYAANTALRVVTGDGILVGQKTQRIDNRSVGSNTGTFTAANAATTTVTSTLVRSTSVITLMPTNAAAATLMAGANSLYVSARTDGTSFVVSTAGGGSAAGTETFEYVIK